MQALACVNGQNQKGLKEMAKLPKVVIEKLEALSPSTRRLYARWLVKFCAYSLTPLSRVQRDEVYSFLVSLARARCSASYQNTALSALRWLVSATGQEVDLSGLSAKRSARLPVVATDDEARALLGHLRGQTAVVVALIYGSGLTLVEATHLPASAIGSKSIRFGGREAPLPAAISARLRAYAALSEGGLLFSVSELTVHRAVQAARAVSGLSRPIGTRELRYGFAARLLESSRTVVEVAKIMGYRRLDTLLKIKDQIGQRTPSPLD